MSNVNSVLQGTISALYVYPVKSCAAVRTSHAAVCATGLMFDREWMVVDTNGHFLTQRAHPRMALIQPAIDDVGGAGKLTLCAPGMEDLGVDEPDELVSLTVKVWRDTVQALDMGNAAALWLSTFLSTPCRLVRFDKRDRRICDANWTGGDGTSTYFADGFPLLVLSAGAVSQLNSRMVRVGRDPVDVSRFRPNIVVDGWPAHAEDALSVFKVSEIVFRFVKPCTRCAIPDIDPRKGEVFNRVNDILRDYRRNPRMNGALTFGMNAVVTRGVGETLTVGQVVHGLS